jgi:hypothetical protein
MKKPKGFNKMTLQEQEAWLVKERQHLDRLLTENSRQLGIVRGGTKIHIDTEINRPDEADLKA